MLRLTANPRFDLRVEDVTGAWSVDGNVDAAVVQQIRSLPSVTDARLVYLPAAPQAAAAPH